MAIKIEITNPDVYMLPLASARACLDSMEHQIKQDGGLSRESYHALIKAYEIVLAVQEHIVSAAPLKPVFGSMR